MQDIKIASSNPAEKGSSLNSCFFAVRTLSTPQLTAEREAVAHDITAKISINDEQRNKRFLLLSTRKNNETEKESLGVGRDM